MGSADRRADEGVRFTLKRHAVTSRREVGAQHELPLEAVCLETAMGVGDFVEGDSLGDARPDRVSG